MINYEEIFNLKPFEIAKEAKHDFLTDTLKYLTMHHYSNCHEYKKILDAYWFNINAVNSYYDLPFIPVRVFKEFDMLSVKREDVFKTMTSSGTTGQITSKIFVDKITSINQTKVMAKIVSSFISSSRVPMLIIDSESILKNRKMFSARSGAILGFSIFGRERFFALDENMQLRKDELLEFIEKHKGNEILVFGFTYMIWLHLCEELSKGGYILDLSGSVLIHGGGWKNLIGNGITKKDFKQALFEKAKIARVYDYYGMVEQASAIYMECDYGHLHASTYSDLIIRRSNDFSIADFGEVGIIQAVSVSPYSYPGHSILTEDRGTVIGEDDCPCGRMGKYFEISGRIPRSEVRGCSDTYEGNS